MIFHFEMEVPLRFMCRYRMKTLNHEFSLPMGQFYVLAVYWTCLVLPDCHINTKYKQW